MKILALAFLLMVGVALVADGLHFHIPSGYLYICHRLLGSGRGPQPPRHQGTQEADSDNGKRTSMQHNSMLLREAESSQTPVRTFLGTAEEA